VILVAGGTGNLGVELVPYLASRRIAVRVLTRDPEHARRRLGDGAEIARGDARDTKSLQAALEGVDVVVSAITGFGPGGSGPRAVDYEGNLNLIGAAEAAGARRFVLVSMFGATKDHPMHLARMKYRAEEALKASRLDWVIVRPNAFMELWAGIVGAPIIKGGKATVFGRGDNMINFNSAKDVARFIELAVFDPELSRTILSIGGPENMTFNQVVGLIERAAGRKASVNHVPVPMMRLSSMLLRPFKQDIAGMIQGGIAFDTVDMTFDATDLRRRFPQIDLTRMTEVIDKQFAATTAVDRPAEKP
jgi:uncharacterized protein YbjT (DUF2867 family)